MIILLDDYLKNSGYQNWNKYSSDRYKFEIIISIYKANLYSFLFIFIKFVTSLFFLIYKQDEDLHNIYFYLYSRKKYAIKSLCVALNLLSF